MYSRGVQVVFVLDTESDAVSKYKPLCYACIRILFSLSDFPSKKPLKWKYMLLKENRPVVGKAPPFMELRLDCMETLFEALKCELGKYGSLNSDKPFPSSLLSCVLADVLQGSLCDSLEIYSPPKRHMWLGVEHEDPLKIVFVYNKCLTSFEGVFSSEIWKCVLDRNIFLCCLYDHGEKGVEDKIGPPSTREGCLLKVTSFCQTIPQPSRILHFNQEKEIGGGSLLHAQVSQSCSGNDYLWLCSNSADLPICIIEVEAILTSSSSCSILSLIQNGSVHDIRPAVGKTIHGTNWAEFAGVVSECDIDKSVLLNDAPFSVTGLSVPSSSLTNCKFLQQDPRDALEGSRKFSREYQNLCVKLAINRLLLVLKVTTTNGSVGWCVLQPISSVMSSLSVTNCNLATYDNATFSPWNSVNLCRSFTEQLVEQQLQKFMNYPAVYGELEFDDRGNGYLEAATTEKFCVECLLPWYPFSQGHGLPSSTFQLVHELQKRSKQGKKLHGAIKRRKLFQTFFLKGRQHRNVLIDKAPKSVKTGTEHIEEVMALATHGYQQQVQSCIEFVKLQEWASESLCEMTEKMGASSLFSNVSTYFLLTVQQLETKYAKGTHLHKEKIAEYLLQVFLRLEVNHLCAECLTDHEITELANEVTCLLRKISLLENPVFLGNSIKEVILPRYSASCKRMLLSVYEMLLLPIPVELGGSSPTLENIEESCIDDSSAVVVGNQPHEESNTPVKSVSKHSFMRHGSFQDHRRIVVKPKLKKGEMRDDKVNSGKVDVSQEGSLQKGPRNVCRTLFKRSMSLNADVGSKRQRDEMESGALSKRNRVDIVVKETPVKKQVENYRQYKLQRLRSKMDVSNSEVVDVVEESPQRSFYSSKVSVRHMKTSSMKAPLQQSKDGGGISEPTCSSVFENENPLTTGDSQISTIRPKSLICTLPEGTLHQDSPDFEESPSMVAFSLSTPTKDDPLSFENALQR